MSEPMQSPKIEFATAAQPAAQRIVSIDALRGFDMFWILGGDALARSLGRVSDSAWAQTFATQLKHVSWEGFVFYDLIFPLFVFLLGMGIVFSLDKIIAREGQWGAHKRIFRRFILLFLLGAFYDSGISDLADESPFSGVLQRLAWCYLFTSLLYCHLKVRGLIAVCVAILLGYWLLIGFVPPPGTDHVDLTTRDQPNLVFYVDEHYLPFKEEGQRWDPEGLLSTIPAIASCLIGVFAGLLMVNPRVTPRDRVKYYLAAGVLLLILGFGWGYAFPIVKRLWTSSYVLYAAGWSLLLVALFYLVIDCLGYRKWATPFIWIGVNPLTLYLLSSIVDFDELGARIGGGPVAAWFGAYDKLWITVLGILVMLAVARFLYKRAIFLRV